MLNIIKMILFWKKYSHIEVTTVTTVSRVTGIRGGYEDKGCRIRQITQTHKQRILPMFRDPDVSNNSDII